jgi:class 3 adenylate cyclase
MIPNALGCLDWAAQCVRLESGRSQARVLGGTGADTGKHAGVVMLGTLGSATRIDSTVIGDAVNLANLASDALANS